MSSVSPQYALSTPRKRRKGNLNQNQKDVQPNSQAGQSTTALLARRNNRILAPTAHRFWHLRLFVAPRYSSSIDRRADGCASSNIPCTLVGSIHEEEARDDHCEWKGNQMRFEVTTPACCAGCVAGGIAWIASSLATDIRNKWRRNSLVTAAIIDYRNQASYGVQRPTPDIMRNAYSLSENKERHGFRASELMHIWTEVEA
ncbi:hypothetical protein BU15DRAFT_62828 [Melanogaster broomeanus]|nr:hypothetical protein BU15DRAFT_62828 [Melanogaster broomeanus]